MSLKIEGSPETVAYELGKLHLRMLDVGGEALNQICEEMVYMAKVLCPKATGSLALSIRKEVKQTSSNRVAFSVKAGGNIINPKTGREVNYAVIVEMKQPFMSPAYAMACDVAVERIQSAVMERCKQ
jgi:hypothetical protein